LVPQVSYLEIYQEKVRDLLVEKKMEHSEEEPGVNRHRPVKKDYIRIREHPGTGILCHSKRLRIMNWVAVAST